MSCRFLAAVTVVAGLALATAPAIAQQPHPGGPGSKAAPTLPPPPPSGPESHALPTPPRPPSGPGVLGETPLSVDAMVAGVNSRLDDAVGYAYTIARNGQVVAEAGVGQARRAVDGTRAFTPTTRLEVMSVTKNMTAIALLKLLQAEAVSIDSPIARWLPLDWPKAGGFKRASQTPITFRHLLTHTSGVNQAIVAAPPGSGVGNSWSGLRALVALGATPNAAPDNYKNANYALMRVLIPRLTGQRVVTEQRAYKRYLLWLNESVFEPSGVASVSCWESVTRTPR
jgi:CubicO group peptidase (beta-lactamase class C family)